MAPAPWQLPQYAPYAAAPAMIVCGDAVDGGGANVGCGRGGGSGSLAVPPRAKTSSREIFGRLLPLMLASPPTMPHDPPEPTMIATYCLPPISYAMGAAITPVCTFVDHSVAPVRSSSAVNSPMPVPWNTSPPAVDRAPPFAGPA